MKIKPLIALSMALALSTLAMPAAAIPINVALGKDVTVTEDIGLISSLGLSRGFGDAATYPLAPLSSVVDGIYFETRHYWQSRTVWWDEHIASSANNLIEIDLDGLFLVSSLSIQADNNDNYDISARDRSGNWSLAWTVPTIGDQGLWTRSLSMAISPIEATAFRIDARGGDLFYSVSEFQAMGEAIGETVPEPGTLVLLGLGLAGLAASRRRKQ